MEFSEKPAEFVESGRRPKSYGDILFHWLTVCLPVIVLFFFAQRYFIQGVVMTGLKG